MELGTKEVPEANSRGVQKARHSLQSKVGLRCRCRGVWVVFKTGKSPRERSLLVRMKSQSKNN